MAIDGWFTVFPYVAAGAMLLALVGNVLVRRRKTAGATEATGDRRLLWTSPAWRLGIGGVLAGHVLALFLPAQLLAWNQHPVRLLALEVTGLAFACLAVFGFAQRLWASRRGASSGGRLSVADSVVLTLLGTVLVSGIAIAVFHRWGSSWFVATLTPYLYSLLRLAPDASGIAGLPILIRLHVLGAFMLAAAVPVFTLGAALARLPPRRRRTSILVAGRES